MSNGELIYPYVEGEYGINPTLLQPTETPRIILSASGRPLNFWMTDKEIYIGEVDPSIFRMFAHVARGILTLDLKTKDIAFSERPQRHPDLYAERFVNLALRHFQNCQTPVNFFRGDWKPGTDNFNSFMEAVALGQDNVTAARNTWSGKTLGKHGFSKISAENISKNYEDGMQAEITALFERV